jgi:SLOG family YspA-like protein
MRVLVCGSRHFTNYVEMRKILCTMFDPDDTVTLIHGNARGADQLSEQALTGYFRGGFEVLRFPADWNKHGKAAGPIRNKQMLDEGKPDLVVAFLAENSRGTKNMIEQATKAGIPVKVINI